MEEQPKVLRYLRELETQKLLELGGELGLDPVELARVSPQELARSLSIRWLQEQDYVKERSGTPTWRSLVKALMQVGENIIAERIDFWQIGSSIPLQERI